MTKTERRILAALLVAVAFALKYVVLATGSESFIWDAAAVVPIVVAILLWRGIGPRKATGEPPRHIDTQGG
jgi:hypothetical protein